MARSFLSAIFSLRSRINAAQEEQRLEAERNPHLMRALTHNKRQGQIFAVRSRWVALAIIGVMLVYLIPRWSVLYYEILLVGFALLGWAQLKVATVKQNRMEVFLIFLDLTLLTFVAVVPNPFDGLDWPTATQYRLVGFSYFYIFLAGATLAYSWRTIFAVSALTTLLWLGSVVLVHFFGVTVPSLTTDISEAVKEFPQMIELIDPNNLMISLRIQDVVVFFIVAGILAINGWRNNQLLLTQARATRERENLSRYFPPKLVDELADMDRPFENIRSQPVAVLFADIVGFTRMAENGNPQKVVEMLREYHKRLEIAVFDNQGTLDKFLGDGIMATFGSPRNGPNDAGNAMMCAQDMLGSIQQWNSERKLRGEQPVILSIGIHYGDVIQGDIGSERRLEFATLGDTVNVAARLEELTRVKKTNIIVSGQVIDACLATAASNDNQNLERFQHVGSQQIRGRDNKIEIWKHRLN